MSASKHCEGVSPHGEPDDSPRSEYTFEGDMPHAESDASQGTCAPLIVGVTLHTWRNKVRLLL